ncbi:biotin transport system substrate-specific component [Evansella vedderi]|uniref:Biotin transporter n=1 Tax=Evansella vedderi TaxID=38282 RepID=A0ABU0A2E1_9BACI|nr:biotin transporter BioY [Evansella vedderi]MDQ0257661.1 biotin transport system substrate-specific component [Evansella vedderi]
MTRLKTNRSKFKVIELTKAAMFIALMAIAANLTAMITIGGVPLTFQTVVAILAGVLLGKKVGTLSMLGYALIGLLGAPVFAQFKGGLQVITSPTFGFILSFIVLAFVVGLIVEKSKKTTLFTYFIACLVGLALNYGIGVPYLYFYTITVTGASDVSFILITLSMTPFFIKDIILVIFTAMICPRVAKALALSTSHQNNSISA